jgi:hypothetical protein
MSRLSRASGEPGKRGGTAGQRAALADRLGIDLDPTRPDQLDRLLLKPEEVDEPGIEALFGLADTSRDVGRVVAAPLLLTWKKARLEQLWLIADHPVAPAVPRVLIDPDVVGKADLRHPIAGNLAYDLWSARSQWLDATFTAIKNQREGLPATPAVTAFDTIVAATFGQPVTVLLALDDNRKQGIAIEPALRALQLTVATFDQLLRLRSVALTDIVLDDEWESLYHLLTQVRKLQQRVAWAAAEATLTMSGSHFVVSTASWLPVPGRASIAQRQDWQDRLQARIDQDTAVREGLEAAVQAVEEMTLPMLRDALVTLSVFLSADRLTELLLIEVSGNGSQRTSRIFQAIETIQQLVLALRAGRLVGDHPAQGWKVEPGSVASFTEEWSWMGTYDTWRAAMFIYNFPEGLLAPTLREGLSDAFADLLATLRAQQRLRPADAQRAAAEFLASIRGLLEAFPVTLLSGESIKQELLVYQLTSEMTPA